MDRPSTSSVLQPTPTPIKLTGTASEWREHVGRQVTVQGRFSLEGKIGPLIVAGDGLIYIKPNAPGSWWDRFRKFEERDVRVTGVLRYWQSPDATPGPVAEARVPNHFYFEEATASIQLFNEQ